MNTKVLKFAASSLVVSATMVGCKPAANQIRPSSYAATPTKAGQQAADFYQKAQVLLHTGKLSEALAAMEQAVALSPRDAGYRQGLADLYMKSGRFASAETTYADVLALDPSNDRAALNVAVLQLAQGKKGEALDGLRHLEGRLSASDLGLAYALAGDPQHALELLEPAARAPDATGRVRQNLALAYAMAGDWKKARVTASQDTSPSQLNARLAQWAALADPSAADTRVASVLGVNPVRDAGQPVRLALAPASSGTAFAQAEATPLAAPGDIARNTQEPVSQDAASDVPQAETAAAPAVAASAGAAEQDVQVAPVQTAVAPAETADPKFVKAARTLVEAPKPDSSTDEGRMASIRALVAARYDTQTLKPTARPAGHGHYVVQLGAFSSPSQVERAWAQVQHRYASVRNREPMSTTVRLGDRLFHRLSVAGFGDAKSAARLCESIRAQGGACFVRGLAGDAPVQWASRNARKA